MTLLIIIHGAALLAQTALLCLILLELRSDRMTRTLRESQRRQWVKEEHNE